MAPPAPFAGGFDESVAGDEQASKPRSMHKRFRPFLNLDLLPTGAGNFSIDTSNTFLDTGSGNVFGDDIDYDLGLSWGLNGGVDFRFTTFFSIAASLRWFTSLNADAPGGADRTVHFDVGPTALFRVPVEEIEIQFPISGAVATYFAPNDGPNAVGVAIGFMPGVLVWVTDTFGLQANFGIDAHIMSGRGTVTVVSLGGGTVSEDEFEFNDVFYNLRMSVGMSLGF